MPLFYAPCGSWPRTRFPVVKLKACLWSFTISSKSLREISMTGLR